MNYDAWGNLLSTTGSLADTLGKRNPFRYRGYFFDEEARLYYLQSRYYNANIGRFINADIRLGVVVKFQTHNLFCYCMNDPIFGADHTGQSFLNTVLSYVNNFANKVKAVVNKIKESMSKTKVAGRILVSNGKAYKIYNPRNYPGVTIGPIPKTIASGEAMHGVFWDRTLELMI